MANRVDQASVRAGDRELQLLVSQARQKVDQDTIRPLVMLDDIGQDAVAYGRCSFPASAW